MTVKQNRNIAARGLLSTTNLFDLVGSEKIGAGQYLNLHWLYGLYIDVKKNAAQRT